MNRRLSKLALVSLLTVCAFGRAAAQQGVTDTEILLGDILPLTGPPALLGVAHNLGVKARLWPKPMPPAASTAASCA
jgi:branched-chain amino acid transport system substrate-binding protein